jgi:hypothetical protein
MNWRHETPDDRWCDQTGTEMNAVPPMELAKYELVERQYNQLDAFVTWLESQNIALAQLGHNDQWHPCVDAYDLIFAYLGIDREALVEERDALAVETQRYMQGVSEPQAIPTLVRALAWEDWKRTVRAIDTAVLV